MQRAGHLGRIGVALVVPQARDLRADVGAVGDVVVEERSGPAVAGAVPVPVDQLGHQLRVPQPLEVHREEGHVGCDVAPPQVVVELEAVEDPRTVVHAEHVFALQVAVPVDDPPGPDPLVEQGATAGEVLERRPSHPGHVVAIEHLGDEPVELVDAAAPQVGDEVGGAGSVDLRPPSGPLVEVGDQVGDRGEVLVHGGGAQERGQAPRRWQPPHHHDVVDHLSLHRDVRDAEVDVGRQPAVQLHLPTARSEP